MSKLVNVIHKTWVPVILMLKYSINNVKWAAPDMIKTVILNTMDKKTKTKKH